MSHWYTKEGVLTAEGEGYPSVSTVLAVRSNEGLTAWKEREALKGNDAYQENVLDHSKESTDKGTAVHGIIEDYLSGLSLDAMELQGRLTDDVMPYVKGFLNWFERYQPETVTIEGFILSEDHGYAGRFDFLCRINGKLYIVDWKTSKGDSTRWKKKAKAYLIQLEAYRRAIFEQTEEWAEIMIVQLTDDIARGYRVYEPGESDPTSNELFEVFLAHKKIFDWAVRIGEIEFEQQYIQDEGLIRI